MKSNQFSCYVIGSESLLIQCAEIMLNRGHDVRGVISTEAPIKKWAMSRNLPVLVPGRDLFAELSKQAPFDYLFSIANLLIISEAILALPEKDSINFHDSPLPKYAGVHATNWALMNQESYHGISWHRMRAEVDEGDIYKQKLFDIAEDETALSLNMKAYEAATDAFEELVVAIETDTLDPQTQTLAELTYFGKYKRPFAAATIDWTKSAEEISALVRALDFGSYVNALAMAKLFMGESIYLVPKITVLGADSTAKPGMVTAVSAESITIATATKDVKLSTLLSNKGASVAIANLEIKVGQQLHALGNEAGQLLNELNDQLVRQEAFWVKRLSELAPVEIPYANHTESVEGTNYVTHRMALPSEIKQLAAERHVSVNDFLITTFAAYLARLSDVDSFDIALSLQTIQDEVNGFKSYFATNVPFRVHVDLTAPIDETLNALQKQVMSIADKRKTFNWDVFPRYPQLNALKEKVGDAVLPVVVENVPAFASQEPIVGSELTLLLVDHADEMCWVFDTAVYTPEAITTMQQQFKTFLKCLTDREAATLAQTALLTDAEYQKLINEWNETAIASYPTEKCIHELFEVQVAKTPEAIAVVSDGQSLSYAELNERANQVAHYLQNNHEIESNQFIGLCMTRNVEMLIGLVGIHKAGAAYLPMDPDYPAERLAYMLEDTQASIILTQQPLQQVLPETTASIICLDTDWGTIAQEDTTNPTSTVQPQNLAYVIHTSGSTGKPKGVQIPHQAVVNFLWSMKEEPGLTSEDTLIAVTTLSFDIAVLELFLPIVVGAKVVIVERDIAMDAQLLAEAITNHQATVMQATPATWNLLISGGWQGNKQLKVLSGGEAISRQLANDLLERVGELWNMYGPTETTIWSTIWPIPQGNESILIGKAIANTDIYILDKDLQPVPISVPGELHIGGDGVSHGYLNRDDLTAERFIDSPFKADAKIYKTGDLARYRADGNIECLGRLDFQVKVRGFRIELGEIETVLLEHEQVEQAVVTAREDGSGGKRLVAYLIAGEAGEVSTPELRAYLGETLPPYMVPSQMVWVEAYPLTPNGKVDRRALPEPGVEQMELGALYAAPRGEIEVQLAAIWADVLNLEQVGVHNNFFELGGHSLLVVRVHQALKRIVDKPLAITDLFRFPTIRTLANYLSDNDNDNGNRANETAVSRSTDRAAARREAMKNRRGKARR